MATILAEQGPHKVLAQGPDNEVTARTLSRLHYHTLIHQELQTTYLHTPISLLQLFILRDLPLHYGLEAQTHRKIRCLRLSRPLPGRVVTAPILFKAPKQLATPQSRAQVFSHFEALNPPIPRLRPRSQAAKQAHASIPHIF